MKTTKAQYEYFKERCKHWVDKLGLAEWHIYYELKELPEGTLARAHRSLEARCASIELSSSVDAICLTKENLNKVALEEVGHILLANMACYAGHYVKKELVTEEEHIIIFHLTKALT